MLPGKTVSLSWIIKWALAGSRYSLIVLPVFASLMIAFGCFFSSGDSRITGCAKPVTSSTSSFIVSPSMTSLRWICPPTSVRIGRVYGSHSTSRTPGSIDWPSETLSAAP